MCCVCETVAGSVNASERTSREFFRDLLGLSSVLSSAARNAAPGIVVSETERETVGTARETMLSAACMYFSKRSGETLSASPMLSKP